MPNDPKRSKYSSGVDDDELLDDDHCMLISTVTDVPANTSIIKSLETLNLSFMVYSGVNLCTNP